MGRCLFLAWCCCIMVTSTAVVAAASLDCTTASKAKEVYDQVNAQIGFDEDKRHWFVRDGIQRTELTSVKNAVKIFRPLLQNKRLLVVGDSTTRNPMATLLSMLCNDKFSECEQVASWFPTARVTSFQCFSGTSANSCDSSVAVYQVPIVNVTSDKMPTKETRKEMWIAGVLPPMARAIVGSLNLTIDVVEAGCSSRDSTWEALGKLLDAPSHVEKRDLVKLLLGSPKLSSDSGVAPEAPFMSAYDAVIVGGGMHCTYKRFSRGWWYHTLRQEALQYIAPRIPVVYIEMTHCLKFAMKRPDSSSKVHCPFVGRFVGDMFHVFTSVPGVFVAPTRDITSNLTLMKDWGKVLVPEDLSNSRCPFADALHPSLACYPAITTSIILTLHKALQHVESLRKNVSWEKCFAALPRRPGTAPTSKSPSVSIELHSTPAPTTFEPITPPPYVVNQDRLQPRSASVTRLSTAMDPLTMALSVAVSLTALAALRFTRGSR